VQKVQNLRLDLLGQTAGGQLIHIDLQSGNDPSMPFRMTEYCLGIQRLFGAIPAGIAIALETPTAKNLPPWLQP